ncbi:MAG TPA: GNAT family protein [Gemmatimonadales bacterium]|nr:GNAT family protein [Gemmatimonadales bacterium]
MAKRPKKVKPEPEAFDLEPAVRQVTHPSRSVTDAELKSTIAPLKLTDAKLAFLTSFVQRSNGKYDDSVRELSLEQLAEMLLTMEPVSFELGMWQGVVSFFPCRPGHEACVHISIWEPLYFRRPALAKALFRFAFKKWSLRRIFTLIPEPNVLANRLAKSVGMTQEGRVRSAFVYNGAEVAGILWGVLPGEV